MQSEQPPRSRPSRIEATPLLSEATAPASTDLRLNERKKNGRRPFMILGGLLLVVLCVIGVYMLLTAGEEATDDAQIAANVVPIAARVPGQLVQLMIHEDQQVKKGDPIARIDDSEYRARVAQAEAELASARAQAAQADAQINVVRATSSGNLSSARAAYSGSSVGVASADAQVAVARAQIARAEADVRKAEADLKRTTELHAANAVPEERLNNAQAAADVANASLLSARAALSAAQESRRAALARVSEAAGHVTESTPIEAQVAVAQANTELAHARVRGAEAALDLAQTQLSYTNITSPADGIASRLSAYAGQIVGAGQAIVELVPSETYVIANFKETQVGRMRPGQSATIEVDAFPHRKFQGKVESISGGTGSTFSLLPADNASGNFVKVVQRVPVRISWVALPSDVPVIAGLSVDAVVHVGE
jgi:membrane fusion protein (multidrug efflux system)